VSAISRASYAPSSLRRYSRRGTRRLSAASRPHSTYRWRTRDTLVDPARAARPPVGLQQDPRVGKQAGRGRARRDQLQEVAPFDIGQFDRKTLLHAAQRSAGTDNHSNQG